MTTFATVSSGLSITVTTANNYLAGIEVSVENFNITNPIDSLTRELTGKRLGQTQCHVQARVYG